jgi:AcrR family transcriptional regulator
MLTPDSAARIDMATDLAIPVIAERGLRAVTPREIAALAGCSRQAVHQWFGSQEDLRVAVAARFVARWTRWLDVREHVDGLAALLPDCAEVLAWTRAWLALVEAAHRDPQLGRLVDVGRTQERDLVQTALHRVTPRHLDDDRLVPATTLVHALVEGLRAQLSHGEPRTTWVEAATVLDQTVAAVRSGGPPPLLA